MRSIIYFAHPVNTYGTEREKDLVRKIEKVFSPCSVENPGREKHQKGYQRWKERTGNGMEYFFAEVLPLCDFGIYLPFRDEAWGAGVFKEAQFFNTPYVWSINADAEIRFVCLEGVRRLSVEETKIRIRDTNGVPLPY